MGNDAYWILSIGGIGIGIGIILYGKKIIHSIGDKLCKITPSRGTCIELSSALVIIIGSRLKLPLSTTHCQVGATVGVGLLENKSFKKIEKDTKFIFTAKSINSILINITIIFFLFRKIPTIPIVNIMAARVK